MNVSPSDNGFTYVCLESAFRGALFTYYSTQVTAVERGTPRLPARSIGDMISCEAHLAIIHHESMIVIKKMTLQSENEWLTNESRTLLCREEDFQPPTLTQQCLVQVSFPCLSPCKVCRASSNHALHAEYHPCLAKARSTPPFFTYLQLPHALPQKPLDTRMHRQ
eukprot:g50968.t1